MFMLLLLCFISLCLAFTLLLLALVLNKKEETDFFFSTPFECGFSSNEENRPKFSLQFFVVALIFLIFDVELMILFPFFLTLEKTPNYTSIWLFIFFLIFLSMGLFIEWNQKKLEWKLFT